MDMKRDVVERLREYAKPTPDDHDVYPNLMKATMTQAAREIEQLRAELAIMRGDVEPEPEPQEPQFYPRATRRFTPIEAAEFLDEALGSNFRAYPNEHEAFQTLFAAVRPTEHGKPEKLRIYVNRKLDKVWTPNKRAAHVAHAALEAFGVHPGVKIVVLDAGPTVIEQMRTHINDAGHTELEPGTLTAGTNWPEDSEA